jgi:hypothetical protein
MDAFPSKLVNVGDPFTAIVTIPVLMFTNRYSSPSLPVLVGKVTVNADALLSGMKDLLDVVNVTVVVNAVLGVEDKPPPIVSWVENVFRPLMVCVDVRSTNVAGDGISATKAMVPVVVGSVSVPVFTMVLMTGAVNVLLVSVAVVALPTSVSAPVTLGKLMVCEVVLVDASVVVIPVVLDALVKASLFVVSVESRRVNVLLRLVIAPMVGVVSVLLVSVSVVARPTNVSVDVGSVSVPVFTMVLMTGAVSVLLVSVAAVALPTSVSVAVALGRLSVCEVELVDASVVVIPVEFPVALNVKRFVASVGSDTTVLPRIDVISKLIL